MDHGHLPLECTAETGDPETSRLRISQSMGRWRTMIGRRVLARLAISNVAPSLEITHLDVLDSIRRAEPEGEVTVGIIAEMMRIDPSRASRIVGEMVTRGALRREASQADARRIIVVMTDTGQQLMAEIQSVKRSVIDSVLADWPEDDVATFSHLFDRFVTSFEQVCTTREKNTV
ncbi:MarR family winged helix-turn-helix transcriptional regulator [Pararhizobium qamdonense]|uniref:MarR family winged helix-turn-helix transcriptional regulator n=2 Tax=Pararhizobium TaxID=1612611 RepID=UPI0023E0F440|nr:MarR family winged helix-turn-helix transcriptional regulator [Pararhizobium qamdonense]